MALLAGHPVTQEWRDRMVAKMGDMSEYELAIAAGTSQAAIRYVFSKAKTSSLVPQIEAALAGHRPVSVKRNQVSARSVTSDRSEDEVITAEVAALREARDAIHDDILRLEAAQATLAERLAEAYEHRAKLDIRIREMRAGRLP